MSESNYSIYRMSRELAHLTQEEAAYRIGIGRRRLSSYENLNPEPVDSTVLRMAKIYHDEVLLIKRIRTNEIFLNVFESHYFEMGLELSLLHIPYKFNEVTEKIGDIVDLVDDNGPLNEKNIEMFEKQLACLIPLLINVFEKIKEKRRTSKPNANL